MSDLVENGFLNYVKAQAEAAQLPSFAAMNYYTSGAKGDLKMPNFGFEMKESTSLMLDAPISEGPLTVWIETQANDEDEATHNARVNAVLGWLQNRAQVSAAITAAGNVKIFGYERTTTTRTLENNHWTTGINLAVGFMPLN